MQLSLSCNTTAGAAFYRSEIPYSKIKCTEKTATYARIRNAGNTTWVSMTINSEYLLDDYTMSDGRFQLSTSGGSDKYARFTFYN